MMGWYSKSLQYVYSGGLCITRESRVDRLQREIHRLRTSPSLRLGAHLTDAIRKPWRNNGDKCSRNTECN